MSHRPWAPAFPGRQGWRHLDAEYALFESSRSFTVGSEDFEWAIVVASGGIELMDPPSRRLSAFSAIRLDPGSTLTLQTAALPTLLIAVKARAVAG
jgi:hypothetical protein